MVWLVVVVAIVVVLALAALWDWRARRLHRLRRASDMSRDVSQAGERYQETLKDERGHKLNIFSFGIWFGGR